MAKRMLTKAPIASSDGSKRRTEHGFEANIPGQLPLASAFGLPQSSRRETPTCLPIQRANLDSSSSCKGLSNGFAMEVNNCHPSKILARRRKLNDFIEAIEGFAGEQGCRARHRRYKRYGERLRYIRFYTLAPATQFWPADAKDWLRSHWSLYSSLVFPLGRIDKTAALDRPGEFIMTRLTLAIALSLTMIGFQGSAQAKQYTRNVNGREVVVHTNPLPVLLHRAVPPQHGRHITQRELRTGNVPQPGRYGSRILP